MFINKILKDDKNTSSLEKPKWSSMKSHPFQNHFFSTLKLIQNTKPVVHSFCAPKIYLSYFYSWNNYGVRNFQFIKTSQKSIFTPCRGKMQLLSLPALQHYIYSTKRMYWYLIPLQSVLLPLLCMTATLK